jgi:hypothetical protein
MDIKNKFLNKLLSRVWSPGADFLTNSDPRNVDQLKSKVTATYVMGSEAVFFDRELIESLKIEMTMFEAMAWRYVSNWRELHIDGFETGNKIPFPLEQLRIPTTYQFFQYAVEKPDDSGGSLQASTL